MIQLQIRKEQKGIKYNLFYGTLKKLGDIAFIWFKLHCDILIFVSCEGAWRNIRNKHRAYSKSFLTVGMWLRIVNMWLRSYCHSADIRRNKLFPIIWYVRTTIKTNMDNISFLMIMPAIQISLSTYTCLSYSEECWKEDIFYVIQQLFHPIAYL